ncbi:MAG TPA: hydantoinase/oxoprolinase family protein [Nitrospinota bacterium]|jgi:N-methylhydantoinase A|nr:hydantoinase/oxoprolinase family protein [Nitrospinota bacterium]HJP14243.1 hydantoinase/oxoprolinase family protein [Nitrospinota bacterium]
MIQIGIDAGGTFTDFWVTEDSTGLSPEYEGAPHKTPSMPEDPSRAVIRGLGEIAAARGVTTGDLLEDTRLIVHGTTVATNAVLTESGARAGLITTQGFRDILEMRRGWREDFFDNKRPLPKPLIRRALRRTVAGRLDETGAELEPLDEASVREEALRLRAEGAESVALCFMHAWANPEHEKRAAEIVRETFPEAFLTVSSELLPQIRLFERVSTCAFNAYVGPIIQKYLEKLDSALRGLGFGGAFLIMGSHGGVMTVPVAARRAAASLLSGPAAAPVAAGRVAAPHGIEDYIVTDMGGTSFDVALVQGGEPLVSQENWLGGKRIALPSLDIHTLGAGGGSVAWADRGGILHIGPESAGASPGPACYGQGGLKPTATDACLALGYLDPEYFLGGKVRLDPQAAVEAINRGVAEPMGMPAEEAALGIYEFICVQMAAGIREVTVRWGLDPRDFLMLAAGGAGPLHANHIARELGISLIMAPRDSAVFCAAGMLASDLKYDLAVSWRARFMDLVPEELAARFRALRDQCRAVLAEQGVPGERMRFEPGMDIRYIGQYHEVGVPLPTEMIDAPDIGGILGRFHERHDTLYGYATSEMPAECITMRMSARGRMDRPETLSPKIGEPPAAPLPHGRRPIRLPGEPRRLPADVYRSLTPGQRIAGPAIVERPNTTVLVLGDYELACDASGNYIIWPETKSGEMRARFLSDARDDRG